MDGSAALDQADPYQPPSAQPAKPPRKTVPASRYLLFFGIAATGCAVDLASKTWIFHRLNQLPVHEWIFGRVFGLTNSLNEGALFGIGQGQVFGFATLSVIAGLAIVIWLFYAGGAEDRLLTIALACIMAGILGNLYDRLGMPGLTWNYPASRFGQPVYAVRDWLHFQIEGLFDWPVFNIADSLLVCGAALLVVHAWYSGKPATTETKDRPAVKTGERAA